MTMAMPASFDPLVDFDGLWTTKLAEQFLPDPRLPAAKYESVNGRLVVSPTEGYTNSWGESKLLRLIGDAGEAAGFYVAGSVNLTFQPGTWIQPDVTVLHTLPDAGDQDIWVPVSLCTMAVEFVSPGNRRKDRMDKPAMCARAAVPYFMRVEIVRRLGHASVELLKLVDGGYVTLAQAVAGQPFEAAEPFPMRFDPGELVP
jgi:Uma2 family endonuclease